MLIVHEFYTPNAPLFEIFTILYIFGVTQRIMSQSVRSVVFQSPGLGHTGSIRKNVLILHLGHVWAVRFLK